MKLFRSRTDRVLAGVLGGLAQSVGINATILRVLFAILLFATGFFPLLIAYLVLVFILPNKEY
ncbi:PspC domain-containing protein [Bacillus sp. V3-13]|uniref:PspC domain-containing protein n=1 Tax=Bacillus sp. V3-13 TaxID=2053728 RepID=UPI0026BC63B1